MVFTTDHFSNPLQEGTYFDHTVAGILSSGPGYEQSLLYSQPVLADHHTIYHRHSLSQPAVQNLTISTSISPGKQPTALLTPPVSSTDAPFQAPTAMKQESPLTHHSGSKSHSITPVSMSSKESPPSATKGATTPADVAKPKRVRTGCLTCRERHLKCDEGLPNCLNCRKSNRKCKRGVRLNFIDIDCRRPPFLLPATHDWTVHFQDDSRDIASEYRGGIERYAPLEQSPKRRRISPPQLTYDYNVASSAVLSHQQLNPQPNYHTYAEAANSMYVSTGQQVYDDPTNTMAHQMAAYAEPPRSNYDQGMMITDQSEQSPPYLTDREELFYMQVFVEEVGIWMDSMDSRKHFSRLLPFQALRQPMLKHALLACGVRHLTLINPAYADEHAVNYYNLATQALLKQLQNPDRDATLCATTATVLNVYEVMSEKALQRMNHIAGARALIKECRWDANATGIGSACFWLNVGFEMFSCLAFNWGVAWDPDTWGIDMTMNPQLAGGNEDEWTHKMLWILAKITNFRASVPKFQEQSVHAEQMRMHQRHQQWLQLKEICDKWESCIPPTMHPLACMQPYPNSKSAFPEVWLIERAPIVARLFYHTAMVLLGAVHPMADVNPQLADEMQNVRSFHSRLVCGIVAHVKDRGVASASIRCLAVAGEYVTTRREQEEVLDIFDKIKKETGWRVTFINDILREKWGWAALGQPANTNGTGPSSFYQGGNPTMPAPNPSRPQFHSGIINPMYKNADFGAQNPPYEGNWVPANMNSAANQTHMMHSASATPHTQAQLYGFAGIPAM